MTRAKIHLLPAELRNQIAAGEVVERPASVVKELVENALDAKATEIHVTIEDGGQGCILVEDNGIGIPKDELELAVTRHATSKLQTVSDLSAISSYGFRGEALPSIASVSKFRIVSKTKDEDTANELCVNFGDIKESMPASLCQGTLIEVRDLFFNIPARLKFLKNPATELKRAAELFVRLALGADHVAMSLVSGSRTVMEFFSHEEKKDKLAKIWSSAIIEALVPVDYSNHDMRLSGFISNPRSVQPRADRMLFYVNGRAVNDKLMLRAIRQAYAGKITTRDYPQCLLFLELDPREVDVNVHPAKSEVRFRDEKALFALTARAVENALASCPSYFSVKNLQEEETHSAVSEAKFGDLYIEQAPKTQPKPQGFWGKADYESRLSFVKDEQKESQYDEVVTEYFKSTSPELAADTEENQFIAKNSSVKSSSTKNLSFDDMVSAEPFSKPACYQSVAEPQAEIAPLSKNFTAQNAQIAASTPQQNFAQNPVQNALPYGLEYMGQVAETYLLLKKDNSNLLILDQHAVHERILYEEIKKGQIQSQNLLCPLELPVHKSEEERYFSVKETLEHLGFSLQEEEKDQELLVQITSIPMCYDRVVAMGFLKEILAEKLDNLDSIWIRHACKSAIKAGTPLDTASAVRLILQWLATEEPDNCPHGRPSVIHFDSNDLEKLFKRKF